MALLENIMGEEEFESFMRNPFRESVPDRRSILGASDTTPPDAKVERRQCITEMVEDGGRLLMKA